MRRWLVAVATTAFAVAGYGCSDQGPEVDGPQMYSAVRTVGEHREVEIRFTAGGDTLVGTLYLPPEGASFASVGISQGSGWTGRATWEEVGPFVLGLDVGVFSWDKRGFGASQGVFSQAADSAAFDIQAADLVAASRALAGAPLVDGERVGVMGTSQGGWIVPLAANADRATIGFAIVFVGGAVSTGQDALYDQLTGYDRCERTSTALSEIVATVYAAGPSGFDPHGSLADLEQETIWIYGGMDMSHSAELSEILLAEADPGGVKPWTVVTLPNANHELVEGGGICDSEGPRADVLGPLSTWWQGVF